MANKVIHFSRLAAEIKPGEREAVIYLKNPNKPITAGQANQLLAWATRVITTNYPGYNIHVKAVENWKIAGKKKKKRRRRKQNR